MMTYLHATFDEEKHLLRDITCDKAILSRTKRNRPQAESEPSEKVGWGISKDRDLSKSGAKVVIAHCGTQIGTEQCEDAGLTNCAILCCTPLSSRSFSFVESKAVCVACVGLCTEVKRLPSQPEWNLLPFHVCMKEGMVGR